MIFGKLVLLYVQFTQFAGGGHRNDAITLYVTQTKPENRQTMKIMDTCFCEESFIDRSFLVLEILRRRHKTLYKTKKPMVSRVKNAIIVRLFLLQLSFAYNPPFYFNMEKSYKDISFSYHNNDNKICPLLSSFCFQQNFHD